MVRVKKFFPLLITFLIFLGVEFFYSPNGVANSETSPTPLPLPEQKVRVSRVIDGDTIEVESGEKVRFIGIDTPELSERTDCYGLEAKNYLANFLNGKEIKMEKDVSDRDKYGRLLRFVYLDGELVNKKIVEDGYAKVSTFAPDVKFQEMFLEAQELAQKEGLGLWSKCF